jgi:hypothetical protein
MVEQQAPEISAEEKVYDAPVSAAFAGAMANPALRKTVIKSIIRMVYNFFIRQYRAAFMPGYIPVTAVDHPLDEKIPFTPSWIVVYLDFVAFWIRVVSFLLLSFGRRAHGAVAGFIKSFGDIYAFAADVYKKNFSTTARPFYIARSRFFMIHLVDPHLMCVPSLHVMVVINAYIRFADIVRSLKVEKFFLRQIEELRRGAVHITESLLYVKQHSVNCVAAAMYAMTCFDKRLFPPEMAEDFGAWLFAGPPPPESGSKTALPRADAQEIRDHILTLYRRFLAGGQESPRWEKPLLDFLKEIDGKRFR